MELPIPYKRQTYLKHRSNSTILQLSQTQLTNFNKVKNSFRAKMIQHSLDKKKRIQLAFAYFDVCHQIFGKPTKSHEKIISFIIQGDLNFLQKILGSDISLRNTLIGDKSLVYYSVMSGHEEVVQFLLKVGCLIQLSGQKSTPLHCASYYGHKHLIPMLLSYGAPIGKKNFANNTPFDEASTYQIKQLLKQIQKNRFNNLQQKLLNQKLTENIINVKYNGETIIKKIILNNYMDDYSNYDDTFHGTKYKCLFSIVKHGLKIPGQYIDGMPVYIRSGHIGWSGQPQYEQKVWGKAIFVSPSIYYSTNQAYSEQVQIDNRKWLPFLQVKVKQECYTKHGSTIKGSHKLLLQEPALIEYRIDGDNLKKSNTFQRQKVVVVSVAFIQKQFLSKFKNYKQLTNLILNSSEEQLFRDYHKNHNK